MRINFILPGLSTRPIGGFAVVYEHASRLYEAGHDVTVVHSRRWLGTESLPWRVLSALHAQLRKPPQEINWYRLHPGVSVRVVRSLAESHIPDADVVIATSWQTANYVHEYARSKGRKYYLIQHFESWSGDRAAVEATWQLPLRKIVVSNWLMNVAVDLGQAESTVHVPNGVDLETFRITTPIENRDASAVAWSYHPAVWKGPGDGLRALALARASTAIKVRAFGAYSRPSHFPPWISYAESPSPSELATLFNSAAVFVHSSRSEGFGLPAAEAMACGCSLAASDSGGVRDFATDRATALLSTPADAAALAGSILALTNDAPLRFRIATAGLQKVQHFSWDTASRRLESILMGGSPTMWRHDGEGAQGENDGE